VLQVSCPSVRVYKSPASIAGGMDLGRWAIFGTFPLLIKTRRKKQNINVKKKGCSLMTGKILL